jgi:hypothetical protein
MRNYIERCIHCNGTAALLIIVQIGHNNRYLEKGKGFDSGIIMFVIECGAFFLLLKNGKEFVPTKGYFCMYPLLNVLLCYNYKERFIHYTRYLKVYDKTT